MGLPLVQRIADSLATLPPRTRAALHWAQFVVAMFGFGIGVALMLRSELGLGPWDAFHTGLNHLTGITVGMASLLMGIVVVAGGWWLGERPAIGTVINMILIAAFIDLAIPMIPPAESAAAAVAYYLVALLIAGVCSGMYISTGLGKGPRDGFTIALTRRTGLSVRQARTSVEVVVLALGWAMGGAVGVGTIMFAFLMGPAMQWGLQLFGVVTPAAAALAAADEVAIG